MGYTEDGEGVSLRIQCVDAKKVSGSVHKMNMGGNVVVLDGKRSYLQNKETNEKTRIRPVCHVHLGAGERGRGAEGDREGVERESLRDLCRGERGSAGFRPAAVCPHEDDQQGDKEQEGGGVRVEEEMFEKVFG